MDTLKQDQNIKENRNTQTPLQVQQANFLYNVDTTAEDSVPKAKDAGSYTRRTNQQTYPNTPMLTQPQKKQPER